MSGFWRPVRAVLSTVLMVAFFTLAGLCCLIVAVLGATIGYAAAIEMIWVGAFFWGLVVVLGLFGGVVTLFRASQILRSLLNRQHDSRFGGV